MTTSAQAQQMQRLIVIGGGMTEVVVALNMQDYLIAVDDSSTYPPLPSSVAQLPPVSDLQTEDLLQHEPTLVMTMPDVLSPAMVDALLMKGVEVLILPQPRDVHSVIQRINLMAEAMGAETLAAHLTFKLMTDYQQLMTSLERVADPVPALLITQVNQDQPMVAGRASMLSSMLTLVRGRNIAGAGTLDRLSQVRPLQPAHVVVVMDDAAKQLRSLTQLTEQMKRDGLMLDDGRVVVMNRSQLLSMGPRFVSALRELATHLHPDKVE